MTACLTATPVCYAEEEEEKEFGKESLTSVQTMDDETEVEPTEKDDLEKKLAELEKEDGDDEKESFATPASLPSLNNLEDSGNFVGDIDVERLKKAWLEVEASPRQRENPTTPLAYGQLGPYQNMIRRQLERQGIFNPTVDQMATQAAYHEIGLAQKKLGSHVAVEQIVRAIAARYNSPDGAWYQNNFWNAYNHQPWLRRAQKSS